MIADFSKFGNWEIEKAVYLLQTALDLNIELTGEGLIGVNATTGNVFLFLEEYSFTLYLPITCELNKRDVQVCYWNAETGEEKVVHLNDLVLYDLEKLNDNWQKGIDFQA